MPRRRRRRGCAPRAVVPDCRGNTRGGRGVHQRSKRCAGPVRHGCRALRRTPDDLQVLSSPPAISPDGRRLAFAALRKRGIAIYVRDLDRFEMRQVAGSDGGYNPFFSPDGQWIGFITGSLVKKAPAEGARPARWRDQHSGWRRPRGPQMAESWCPGSTADYGPAHRAGPGLGPRGTDPHRRGCRRARPSGPGGAADGRLLFTVLRERGGIISCIRSGHEAGDPARYHGIARGVPAA